MSTANVKRGVKHMRTLTHLFTALALAGSLAACKKGGEGSKDPGSKGAKKTQGTRDVPTVQAKAEFDKVAAAYEKDVLEGSEPSAEACNKYVGKFQKLYKQFGDQMTIAEFNAAALQERCGDKGSAEKSYTALANKKYMPAMNNLGVLLWNQGNHAKALEWFDKAVAADPKRAFEARNNLAAAKRDTYAESLDVTEFDAALKNIQNILAVDTSNKMAYENLARLYYDRGRLKDKSYLLLSNLVVSQALRVLKEEGEESSEIYNLQGLLLMQDDNQVDALRAFKKAVEVEPNHVDANLNIAFIAIRFRDYVTAEKSLKIAMAAPRVQRDIEAQIALGVAQRGLKQYTDAEATYMKAVGLDAEDPRPWFNLGVLYQDHRISEDGVDQAKTEEFYRTAQKHFDKYCSVAAGKACKEVNTKSMAKSAKRGRTLDEEKKLIADAKLRVIVIDEAFAAFRQMEELERKMKELAKIEAEQAAAEKARLLELERMAREAEEADDEEGDDSAADAGDGAASE